MNQHAVSATGELAGFHPTSSPRDLLAAREPVAQTGDDAWRGTIDGHKLESIELLLEGRHLGLLQLMSQLDSSTQMIDGQLMTIFSHEPKA